MLAMVVGNHEPDVPPLACGAPAACSAAMAATHLHAALVCEACDAL